MSSHHATTKSRLKPWSLFIVGGVCLAGALLVMSLTPPPTPVAHSHDDEDVVYPTFQVEQVAAVPNLGVLTEQVRPLQQTTRVVTSGAHESEFRGTKFINEYRNRYSIQIAQVSKEDIIKNFLQLRADRKKFTYIRLSGENQSERYVLLYGIYDGEQEAKAVLSRLNLNLPTSIKPNVEKIANYAAYVNDMGADEGSDAGKLYDIRLTNAPLPKVVLPVLDPEPETQLPSSISEASVQKITPLSGN
ncbi:SPOR domain-containing protein [Acinetobacter rathckeae]|uniref:SPOR domain-containing protein n=1 Tax=Acinetobacter rathckeae TaxID=2605272 RepID=UPI0018A24ED4|nr:SPOR domain-containing protein [Acinetobacter rathckeae]MBF7688711.1 SPOR domain-containing protein [Acinetobacter rathckeae]MBF7696104.1 SPOR domain-containing protein [Acinetobacter rathckeae]